MDGCLSELITVAVSWSIDLASVCLLGFGLVDAEELEPFFPLPPSRQIWKEEMIMYQIKRPDN
jgi:hypothetical protein